MNSASARVDVSLAPATQEIYFFLFLFFIFFNMEQSPLKNLFRCTGKQPLFMLLYQAEYIPLQMEQL